MKLWRPPLLFVLTEREWVEPARGDWRGAGYWALTWTVAWSDGVSHYPLGECRRTTTHGPNQGTVNSWSAWPPGATEPLKPAHPSLLGAGRELAVRARRKV